MSDKIAKKIWSFRFTNLVLHLFRYAVFLDSRVVSNAFPWNYFCEKKTMELNIYTQSLT